jgi:putative transposase
MTEQERISKNINIRNTQKATLARRSLQSCFVYKLKIDHSKLSIKQKEHLKMLFVEAKWLYNDILNYSLNNNISTYITTNKFVSVKTINNDFILKPLHYIGSQMKQSVVTDILANLKGLKTLKEHNHKIGWLKFKSSYKSLNLKQYSNTYKFYNNKKAKIQGVPGKITVNGLNQFINDPNIEIANGRLLNTSKGYYVAVTVYRYTDQLPIKKYIDKEIGVDMGIKTSITLSNGEKIVTYVEETEHLKCLQRKLSRQKKGSNNRRKTIYSIQKEYQKITDRKNDIANKIVAKILSYEKVYIQDENISIWKKGLFGKQVQHSVLGRIKAKLINNERVQILDRLAPTTKFCPKCYNINKDISLKDRMYICPICGYMEDRDIHAAKNMIIMTKLIMNQIKLVPMGHRDFKPVEINTTDYRKYNNMIDNKVLSMKQEAHQPLGCA